LQLSPTVGAEQKVEVCRPAFHMSHIAIAFLLWSLCLKHNKCRPRSWDCGPQRATPRRTRWNLCHIRAYSFIYELCLVSG